MADDFDPDEFARRRMKNLARVELARSIVESNPPFNPADRAAILDGLIMADFSVIWGALMIVAWRLGVVSPDSDDFDEELKNPEDGSTRLRLLQRILERIHARLVEEQSEP